jgi:hypothetical protein
MTPAIFRSFANRFGRFRWRFLAASLLCFGLIAILIAAQAYSYQPATWLTAFAFGVLVPLGLICWGLLLVCFWFHSVNGKFEANHGIWSRMPNWLRTTIRWYAALFLTIWLFASGVLWPIQSAKLFL